MQRRAARLSGQLQVLGPAAGTRDTATVASQGARAPGPPSITETARSYCPTNSVVRSKAGAPLHGFKRRKRVGHTVEHETAPTPLRGRDAADGRCRKQTPSSAAGTTLGLPTSEGHRRLTGSVAVAQRDTGSSCAPGMCDHSKSGGGPNSYAAAPGSRTPTGFAGTPATIVIGATFFVTIAPAATTAPRPTVTPGRIIARDPIQT
jgi:hypothetical protein